MDELAMTQQLLKDTSSTTPISPLSLSPSYQYYCYYHDVLPPSLSLSKFLVSIKITATSFFFFFLLCFFVMTVWWVWLWNFLTSAATIYLLILFSTACWSGPERGGVNFLRQNIAHVQFMLMLRLKKRIVILPHKLQLLLL